MTVNNTKPAFSVKDGKGIIITKWGKRYKVEKEDFISIFHGTVVILPDLKGNAIAHGLHTYQVNFFYKDNINPKEVYIDLPKPILEEFLKFSELTVESHTKGENNDKPV